ncbi:MAG: hypothetical protein NTAFB05_08470 [Nitrobacter sp.]
MMPIASTSAPSVRPLADMRTASRIRRRQRRWRIVMPDGRATCRAMLADLWGFIVGLDQVSVMALFAHCAGQTVNAVKRPWERKPRALEAADKLSSAVALDMTAHWTPRCGPISAA